MSTCYIGVDVGLTASKAAAFDTEGRELHVVTARTPRTCVTPHRHDVDMEALADTVLSLLGELAAKLAADGRTPAGIGVAAHGNGLYPVDVGLRPVGPAIASSDSRAQRIVDALAPEDSARLAAETGSIPWAAQPAVLLRWLHDHEPEAYRATRWVLSCKDWVTSQLTGIASADYSDASAFGMVALDSRRYTATTLELVGLPADDLRRFPPCGPPARWSPG
ncbi:FGGY-family carbohydrate kinase [Streptomyces hirsutus]